MEKLEAKHIAPYLPYKLMFWHTKLRNKQEMSKMKVRQDGDILVDIESNTLIYISSINDSWIKPILRPIEDLYNEKTDCGIKIIHYFNFKTNVQLDCRSFPYHVMEQLFKYHFDVFGLIDKGLAVSYLDVQSTSNEG